MDRKPVSKSETRSTPHDDRILPEPPRRMRNYSPNVHKHLKTLRHGMTPMESVLWSALRNRQVEGTKFRRQHPIDSLVLDFYAPELKLAIELDGDVHNSDEQRVRDANRTRKLEAIGIRVDRVSNRDVGLDVDRVARERGALVREIRGLPS